MATLGVSDVHYFDTTGDPFTVLVSALTEQGSWTIEDSGGASIIYSNDPSSLTGFLRVESADIYGYSLSGFETLEDAQANTNSFNTRFLAQSKTQQKIRMYCDSRTFYIFNGDDFFGGAAFGDLIPDSPADQYHKFLAGSGGTSTSTGIHNANNIGGAHYRCARAVDQVTAGSALYLQTIYRSANYNVADRGEEEFPSSVTGSLHIAPIDGWQSTGLRRGRFPGIHAPEHRMRSPSALYSADGQAFPAFSAPDREFMIQRVVTTQGCFAIDITGPWRDDGTLSISGVVTEVSVPGAYRVNLFLQSDMQLVKTTWSDANGNYAFTNLKSQKYVVMAIDHTSPIRSPAIQDNVIPS